MVKKLIISALILLEISMLLSCNIQKNELYQSEFFNMGTIISQNIYGSNAEIVAQEAEDIIKDIEAKMTTKTNNGEVNRLNSASGNGNFISLSNDTFNLLQKSKSYYQISNGTFDISIGPIVKLWGIGTENQHIPSNEEVLEKLRLVNFDNLELDEQNLSARLNIFGQEIDLGGIAKGYAADKVIEIYKKHGIKSALINLGGNISVLGNKPNGEKWSVGIQNPRKDRGNYIGILKVTNKSVVTSGDYERFFIENDKMYHHIFDPKTGYPANSDLMSATIIADISTDADVLSTATFILGLEKGMSLIESLDNVNAIFITKDKKIYATSGIIDEFTFNDTYKEFDYIEKR